VDLVFREALNLGVLLAGVSAGAMCWFECGLTDSFWQTGYRPLPGLGFLPGGCGVHYHRDVTRRARVHAAIEARAIPASTVIDDSAAVLFCDGVVERVVSWREGATAYRIVLEGGRVQELAYPCEQIKTDTR
jgi:peptidase E